MSEKRYKIMTTIIDPFPIWDTVEEKGYNCTDTLDELVDLLNNLTEENKRLQNENTFLVKQRNYWKAKYDEGTETFESVLAEENEKLRKELNDCEKFRYTVFKRMGELNYE